VPGHDDKTLKINLWDTAGQEKFQSLTSMYVKDAAGIILVYDMTYADSVDGVRQWYNMVQEHLDLNKVVMALVGNKCDCNDEIQVNPQQAKHLQ
jgi:small GTP-binding protein